MEKAKVNEFSTMTIEQARKLPLDGKVVDGKPTSLTLKRGLVKDDGKEYVERRIFRNADMQDVCLYDLPIPLTEPLFNKIPFSERLDHYAKSIRVYTDGIKAGKGGSTPEKRGDKAIAELRAQGVPEELIAQIQEVRKGMKTHGFGK